MKTNEYIRAESYALIETLDDLEREQKKLIEKGSISDREKWREINNQIHDTIEMLVRGRTLAVLKKFVPHLRDEDYEIFYDEYITHKHFELIKKS